MTGRRRPLRRDVVAETVVMPMLCAALHDDELEMVHMTQRRSMPLDVLVDGLGVMLPAMNIGERADMLAGLSSAPADVFAIVRRAAESALPPAERELPVKSASSERRGRWGEVVSTSRADPPGTDTQSKEMT